jgi:hypothetical protein
MDNIKDILQNIKERFTNPLIFSFVCSWIFINWEISLAVLWHDNTEIKNNGCTSIYEFISDNLNTKKSLWYPLFFAISYTFLIPIIRNIIRAFHSWTIKWGENWSLKISKGAKIPFTKYIKIRDSYNERSKSLEAIILKENEIIVEYNTIKTTLLEKETKLLEANQKNVKLDSLVRQITNVETLNGFWKVNYNDEYSGHQGTEDILIENGKYYIIEKNGNNYHKFNITNFYFHPKMDSLSFIKERIYQKVYAKESELIEVSQKLTTIKYYSLKFNLNVLNIAEDGLLNGFENGNVVISYKKKEDLPLSKIPVLK